MKVVVEISVEISHRNYYDYCYATAAAAWDMTVVAVKIVRVVEIDDGNCHHLPHLCRYYCLHSMHDDIAAAEDADYDDYTKAVDLRIDYSNDNYYYCSVLRHRLSGALAHQHYPHYYYYY